MPVLLTLADVRPVDRVRVVSIRDEFVRLQAIRFGLHPGAEVVCEQRLRGGPVVIRCGRQEVAIGRQLARDILVEPCGTRPVRAGESGRCGRF